MLKSDVGFLWDLYKSAKHKRDRRLSSVDRAITRLCGPGWEAEATGGEIENPEFELLAQKKPRILWDNPRVRVTTVRPGPAQDIARAINSGLNRNIVQTDIRKEADLVLTDMLLRWGVMFTELEELAHYGPTPGVPDDDGNEDGGIPRRPISKRVSFRRYFEDPTATNSAELRFRGFECIEDIDDMIAHAEAHPDEGWNVELLESLKGDTGVESIYRPKMEADAPDRGQLAYVRMYVEGFQIEGEPGPDEGFHGAWFTFLVTGADSSGNANTEELRPPYMAFCPKGGPFVVFGEYNVPDEKSPLAGIEAAAAAIEERAAQSIALATSSRRRKKIALVDGLGDMSVEEIRDSKDGDVLVAPGLDTQHAMEMELGGPSDAQVAMTQWFDTKCDRLLQTNDANVGVATGKATATEVRDATGNTSERLGGTQRTFSDYMADVLRIEAWYLFHTDTVAFPLPPEARALEGVAPGVQSGVDGPIMSPPDPWFHGGNTDKSSGLRFEDLELLIEPYSMIRTSPETQMAMGMYLGGALIQEVTALTMAPAIDPEKWIRARADTLNFPTLPDLIDPKIIRLQQGLGMMALMPQAGQPQLAGDVGAGPSGMTTLRQLGPGPSNGAPGGGRSGAGAFGSKPQKTGTERIGMKTAGPASRQKPKGMAGAK